MNTAEFEGACPFLGCRRTDRHVHPKCQTCGAVPKGNLFCPECRQSLRANATISGAEDLLLLMADTLDAISMGLVLHAKELDVQT